MPTILSAFPPFIGGKDIRAALADDNEGVMERSSSHQRERRFRDVLVGPRRRKRGEGQRAALWVRDNEIDHTGVQPPRGCAPPGGEKAGVAPDGNPASSLTKATGKAAAVRIAITVAAAGRFEGVLREVVREAKLDTDQPEIDR